MVSKGKIPDQLTSLTRLRDLGFSPKVVFDIGAYNGEFSDFCTHLWPTVCVHAFEGLPDKIDFLQRKFEGSNVRIVPNLVGESNRENVEFFADETASSVLYSDEVYSKKKLVRQKMISLDAYIEESSSSAPTLLKIDTQGYEFPIIKGCERNLNDIDVFIIETNFIEVYHHSANASEVIGHLYERGFVIYDICEIHRRPLDQALVQVDFMFVKKDSFLRQNKLWDKKQF